MYLMIIFLMQAAELQRSSGAASGVAGAGSQYYNQNWRADGRDDGQVHTRQYFLYKICIYNHNKLLSIENYL